MEVTGLSNFSVGIGTDGTLSVIVSVMPQMQNEKYFCVFVEGWLAYAKMQTPPLPISAVLADIEAVAKALGVPIPAYSAS
jgi:hypothetical protein